MDRADIKVAKCSLSIPSLSPMEGAGDRDQRPEPGLSPGQPFLKARMP